MADDLLEKLTESKFESGLPALPSDASEPEPREPTEVSTFDERGRSPDEVVQARETRLPADEPRYEIEGRRYTAEQLEKSGKLEELSRSHANYAALQAAYQALAAERQRAEAPAPPAQITNAMIASVYDAVAQTITNDLVNNDLVEADLPEAYPRAFQTMVGQMRFLCDKIAEIESTVLPFIREVQQAKATVQSQAVAAAYYGNLDALVQSDPQFYAGLRNRKTRDSFTRFLVEEVGATVGQTTGANAQLFLKKQWSAYNSDTILDAARGGIERRRQAANKRFVAGESTGSRSGIANMGEQSMLERMIQNSQKIPE